MRISFVLGHELPFPQKSGGGVNSLLSGLVKELAAIGHEVVAYSPLCTELPIAEEIDGVRHIRVLGTHRRQNNIHNVLAGVPYALRIRHAILPCDVLSCHFWHGFLLKPCDRFPILTHTIHRDPKKFLLLFKQFDRIYAGTNSIVDDAKKLLPSMAGRFKTIFNCVDFSSYSIPTPRSEDGFVIFSYIGRFSRDKGLETLIRAFAAASKINQHIRLRLIGPMDAKGGGQPDFVKEMKEFVASEELGSKVSFLEPIYNRALLDEEICRSDVIVLPSIGGETLNMSILESMRLGRALLLSDLEANKPLTVDEQTGLFAKAGDIADWKQKILLFATNFKSLQQMGIEAYKYGRDTFSTRRIATQYVEDFQELLDKKKNV